MLVSCSAIVMSSLDNLVAKYILSTPGLLTKPRFTVLATKE